MDSRKGGNSMRLEDMREQFPKMPESMKQMIEQEVTVQIGQEKENDNPKVVTYKKRKKKNTNYFLFFLIFSPTSFIIQTIDFLKNQLHFKNTNL